MHRDSRVDPAPCDSVAELQAHAEDGATLAQLGKQRGAGEAAIGYQGPGHLGREAAWSCCPNASVVARKRPLGHEYGSTAQPIGSERPATTRPCCRLPNTRAGWCISATTTGWAAVCSASARRISAGRIVAWSRTGPHHHRRPRRGRDKAAGRAMRRARRRCRGMPADDARCICVCGCQPRH